MRNKDFITIAILIVGFICAFYGMGCDKGSNVPDSPRPSDDNIIISYDQLAKSATGLYDPNAKVIKSEYFSDQTPRVVESLADGTTRTIIDYKNLPVSEIPKGDRIQNYGNGQLDCSGSMVCGIRCRNKNTLIVTNIPSNCYCISDAVNQSLEIQCAGGCPSRTVSCSSY